MRSTAAEQTERMHQHAMCTARRAEDAGLGSAPYETQLATLFLAPTRRQSLIRHSSSAVVHLWASPFCDQALEPLPFDSRFFDQV